MRDTRKDPSPRSRVGVRPLPGEAYDDPATGGAAPGSGLGDRLAFLLGFVRDPAGVGSVVPSSHRLERRLVREARIADARTIVELGPGTGGTTRAFLRAMTPQARLLAIELDPVFHRRLADAVADPRLFAECASAERIGELLAARRLPAPDAIVSGIPFSTMPQDVGERIAAGVASVLAPGGRFVAYQVRPRVADFATPHLGPPRFAWEWWNVPPMRVFTWVKPA
ncbi:MAG TPA: methyltransferase type 12 [Burkholderiaceae bacterium]|nr:methyltransferase type 12 [Burkholderiaceae bacterium]